MECRNNFFRKFHSLSQESTGASLIYGDHALSSSLVLQMSNKEDFKDFEAMTEKTDFFHPVNLSLSRVNKIYFKEAFSGFILINIPLQLHKKTSRNMVGILYYNTHINTLILTPLAIVWFCMYQSILIPSGIKKCFFYILIFSNLVPLLITCNHSFEVATLSNLKTLAYG